ncbi:Aste57867_3731 [Aphanomyces stellatus]|uniref:Aste57867_3731 protein n=1 Tax=Aphanomyces stellatus TaxID=120398 RepID=A0A485KE50_9STRA|nr:hypothetical protein As57867_003720 [Aphanomyces stellatus]VFT80884.1 Aste57867_3731 [Aphanomyces stellatus]
MSTVGRHNRTMASRVLLPPELLERVAPCIEDAPTFFAFLEALGNPTARGPFDPLWEMGLTTNRNNLWPILRLDNLDNALHDDLTRLLPLYSRVQVYDAFDIAWLTQHLPRHVKLDWLDPPQRYVAGMELEDWYNAWATLPVSSITVRNVSSGRFTNVLPRLHCLESLTVQVNAVDGVKAVLEYAAKSPTLVKLALSNEVLVPWHVTPAMVQLVLQWLERQPVSHLALKAMNFGQLRHHDGGVLLAEFCTKLLASPTLDELHLIDINLSDMAHIASSIGMRKVELRGLAFPCVLQLLDSKVAPRLKQLDLWDVAIPNDPSLIQLLIELITKSTTLMHLALRQSQVDLGKWHNILPFLPALPLESLHLGGALDFRVPDEFAFLVAQGLEANQTLACFMCYGLVISVDAALTLLQCLARRSIVMRSLAFTLVHDATIEQKKAIRAFAKRLGTTLIMVIEKPPVQATGV